MSTFAVVTTCSGAQWRDYGLRMAQTFARHWPGDVVLTVYVESLDFFTDRVIHAPNVAFLDLHRAAPWLAPWQTDLPTRFRSGDFRHDALRFSFKVAALGAAADKTSADVLVWLDGDTVTHSQVTTEWLERLMPPDADVALLTREPHYPETGFMLFRRPQGLAAVRNVVDCYRGGAVLDLEQQHDAYVVGRVVNGMVKAGALRLHSLSGPHSKPGHPWLGSPLAQKLDHLKGRRKALGRTPKHERTIRDGHPYWS